MPSTFIFLLPRIEKEANVESHSRKSIAYSDVVLDKFGQGYWVFLFQQKRGKLNSESCWREFPGWKNMAAMPWFCHDRTMIMSKHGHDHAMMTAWRPCFLAWSSWFMAWSWYDYHVFHDLYHDSIFWINIKLFVNFFSNSWCHIPLYVQLDWLKGIYASKLPSQWTKNPPGFLEFSSVTTRQQVLFEQ